MKHKAILALLVNYFQNPSVTGLYATRLLVNPVPPGGGGVAGIEFGNVQGSMSNVFIEP
jgi:hypothetical protein